MIVRNEAEALPACLDAARPFVDEIVVVDTGSTDATRDIAAAHGARVIERSWDDDFSAARNASLDAATGDWILVLDADERLSAAAGAELREAANRRDVLACFLPLANVYDDAGSTVVALIVRAWRNRPEIRFRGRIHEQVLWAVNPLARREAKRLVRLQGVVAHDGYRPEIVAARGKNERNLRLFEAAVAEAPQDLYLRWKFADFLRRFPERRMQRIAMLDAGVRDVVALSRDEVRELPFAAEFFALRAEEARKDGEAARAAEVVEAGLDRTEPTANLRFVAAVIALEAGDHAGAERGFRSCLALAEAAQIVPGQPGVTGDRAQAGLAAALRALGRDDEARVEYERLLESAPDPRPDVLDAWFECVLRSGSPPRAALAWLTNRLASTPKHAATWSVGGRLLEMLGLLKDAATWRLRAADLRADDVGDALRTEDLSAAAECLLRAGELEPALALAAEARSTPRAQAVVAAVGVVAGAEIPQFVDAAAPNVRAAFKRLAAVLQAGGGAGGELAARLVAARESMPVFDPAAATLLAETL